MYVFPESVFDSPVPRYGWIQHLKVNLDYVLFLYVYVYLCVCVCVCLRIPKLQQNETSILILVSNMWRILQTEFHKQQAFHG